MQRDVVGVEATRPQSAIGGSRSAISLPRSAQLVGIQYLRAVAALSVAMAHVLGFVVERGGPDLVPVYFIGAAGVDLFFVISGFVMIYSSFHLFGVKGGPAQFIRKRLYRIVPLYWLATAGWIAFRLSTQHFKVWQPVNIVASLLFWPMTKPDGSIAPIYGIGWTLNVEMFFYAVFTLGLTLSAASGVSFVVVFLCALVCVAHLVPLALPFRFWGSPVTLDFVFGMVIGLAYLRGVRLPARWAVAIGVLGASALVTCAGLGWNFASDSNESLLRPTVWGLPSAAIFVAVVLRSSDNRVPYRALAFIGDASYSIYLIHPLVIVAFWPVIPNLAAMFPEHPTVPIILHVVGIVALILLLGITMHLTVERPLVRMLNGKRRPVSATADR